MGVIGAVRALLLVVSLFAVPTSSAAQRQHLSMDPGCRGWGKDLLTIFVPTDNVAPMAQTIGREIRQTKPFRSLQEQLVLNLMLTTRVVEESWTQYLKRAEGISPSQYNILRILRGARPKAARISEIADRMVTRDPDVTRLVDRLIKQGLARRERDGDDRRVVLVEITAAGLALLARLDGPAGESTEAAMAGLKPQQLRTLDTLLNEVRAGIRPYP
jgi:DNA-binding MarR family transcriptional regulator